jgi:hypothetical protein
MKSILKFIRAFAREHPELAKAGSVLLIFSGFTLLAFLLGEFKSKTLLEIGIALALFAATGSFNVYLVPMLAKKESVKWKAFGVLAAFTVTLIFLAVFGIIYLPMLSMIFVGAFTFYNLIDRYPVDEDQSS